MAQHIDSIDTSVFEEGVEDNRSHIADEVDGIIPHIKSISDSQFDALQERIRGLQEANGYDGDYRAWVARHLPVRLETIVGGH